MIVQYCYLDRYDWLVKVFYEVEPKDSDTILNELDEIDCDPEAFYKLAEMLESNSLDWGFTYTDHNLHETFLIIGSSSCAAEFRNTFDHEKGHTVAHIAKYYSIDPFGEELLYLSQSLGELMFLVALKFMCDHCRLNLYNYGKIKVKMY